MAFRRPLPPSTIKINPMPFVLCLSVCLVPTSEAQAHRFPPFPVSASLVLCPTSRPFSIFTPTRIIHQPPSRPSYSGEDFWFDLDEFEAGFGPNVEEDDIREDREIAKSEWEAKESKKNEREEKQCKYKDKLQEDEAEGGGREVDKRGGAQRASASTHHPPLSLHPRAPVEYNQPIVGPFSYHQPCSSALLQARSPPATHPSLALSTPVLVDEPSKMEPLSAVSGGPLKRKQVDPKDPSVVDESMQIDLRDAQPAAPSPPRSVASVTRSPPPVAKSEFPQRPPPPPDPPFQSTSQALAPSAAPYLSRYSNLTPSGSYLTNLTPSGSYLTNVTTSGDSSGLDSDAAPSLPKKPYRTKSDEPYRPLHIRKMLERNAAARQAAAEGLGPSGPPLVALKGKKSKVAKPQTHFDFSQHASKLNDELVRLKKEELAGKAEKQRLKRARLLDGCVFYMVWDQNNLVTANHAAWLDKISSHGAIISAEYDPSVTHVISAPDFDAKMVLKQLKKSTFYDLIGPFEPFYVSTKWYEASEKAKVRVSEQPFLTFPEQRRNEVLVNKGGTIDLTENDDDNNTFLRSLPIRPASMVAKNQPTYQHSTRPFHVPGFAPRPCFTAGDPHGCVQISTTSAIRNMDDTDTRCKVVAGRSKLDSRMAEVVEEEEEIIPTALSSPHSGAEQDDNAGDAEAGTAGDQVGEAVVWGAMVRGKLKDELDEMIGNVREGQVDESVLTDDEKDDEEDEAAIFLAGISASDQTSPFPVPVRIYSKEELEEMSSDEEEEYQRKKADFSREYAKQRAAEQDNERVFQCQRSSRDHQEGPNEPIAMRFEELGELYKAQTHITESDKFRAQSYPKIAEIIKSGTCTRLELELANPKVAAARVFSGIYGIGTRRANQLYDLGARDLADLRRDPDKYNLSLANRIGLQYYDDLKERIPRAEITELFEVFNQVVKAIDPLVSCQTMGSYRRGAKDCGDIDILISRDTGDGNDHGGILDRALRALRKSGFLIHDLANPKDDAQDLEAKYMGLCRLSPSHRVRRIDILTIPFHELGAALIYFTGNDIFNRSLRLLAHKKGLSLNQRGLYKDVIRDRKTRLKTTAGTIIASRTEKEIFDALNVTMRTPEERIC